MAHNKGNSARSILLGLGMGDYNATMVIQYMFIAPAQSDPQMPPIIMLVKHLQRVLCSMGVNLPVTGSVDGSWAAVLAKICGPSWHNIPWAEIARMIMVAKQNGVSLSPQMTPQPAKDVPADLQGVLDSLPSVPGGLLTYALGGFLLYRHFKKAR